MPGPPIGFAESADRNLLHRHVVILIGHFDGDCELISGGFVGFHGVFVALGIGHAGGGLGSDPAASVDGEFGELERGEGVFGGEPDDDLRAFDPGGETGEFGGSVIDDEFVAFQLSAEALAGIVVEFIGGGDAEAVAAVGQSAAVKGEAGFFDLLLQQFPFALFGASDFDFVSS